MAGIEECTRNILVSHTKPEIQIDKTRQIINLCCDLHWEFYPDTIMTIFSEGYRRTGGWDKLVYEKFSEVQELVYPDDIDIFEERIKDVVEGRRDSFDYEFRWLYKNGTYLWLNNRCLAFKDSSGKSIYFLGLTNNITEQRQKERFLQEEKKSITFENNIGFYMGI